MTARSAILALLVLPACAADQRLDDIDIDIDSTAQAELVRVPAVDPTEPMALLRIWEKVAGGGEARAPGSWEESMFNVQSRQSKLGLRLSGIDLDSGMHELTIYCRKDQQECATCAWTNVADAICFQDTFPLVPPGDYAEDLRWIEGELDLTTLIPQTPPAPNQTRKVGLGFHAVVTNNYQVIDQTDDIYLTYTEKAPPPCLPTCNAACVKSCPSGREYLPCKHECQVDCADACSGLP